MATTDSGSLSYFSQRLPRAIAAPGREHALAGELLNGFAHRGARDPQLLGQLPFCGQLLSGLQSAVLHEGKQFFDNVIGQAHGGSPVGGSTVVQWPGIIHVNT